jgi:CDP-paratose synthetase
MKVLVTGATGFLGSYVVRELLHAGHQVVALQRPTSDPWRLVGAEPRIATVTVNERSDLVQLFRGHPGIASVIHTAGNYGRPGTLYEEVLQSNVVWPLQVLRAARTCRVRSFVNANTALPPKVSPYAVAKAQFRDMARVLEEGSETRFVNARIEMIYGPEDDVWKLVPMLITRCLAHETAIALTLGEQRRDLVFVKDVARALVLLAELAAAGDACCPEEPDIGSGHAIRIRDLAELIRRMVRSPTHLDFGAIPYRPHEVMESVARIEAMQAINWVPDVLIEEGLSQTIESYRSQYEIAAS